MTVIIETTVTLVDTEDSATLSFGPSNSGDADGREWAIGGEKVYATTAEMREFAEAILELVGEE